MSDQDAVISGMDAVRLIEDPLAGFTPNNPPWLVAAAQTVEQGEPVEPPECPAVAAWLAQAQTKAAKGEAAVEFGAAARAELFQLRSGVAYLNHGSYGATLRLLSEAQRWWQQRQEAQPVEFMETECLQGLIAAQRAVAGFVGADPRDIAFLPNATAAANAVLRSLRLAKGDLVLVTDLTYAAVRNVAARMAAEAGAGLVEVRIADVLEDGETGDQRVLARFEAGLAAGSSRIRLAIIDQIISPLPVHLPVAALCALCRSRGVPALVDGAHALGAVTLDVPSLGATYWTGNCHKWMCTPKGVAVLWVERSAQPALAPLVTSHGYRLGFQGEFLWQGTRDYSALLTLPAAVAILRALGLERAGQYRRQLLGQAAALLGKAWGTQEVLGLGSSESCMAAVQLPQGLAGAAAPTDGVPAANLSTGATASALHALLRRRFSIEVPVVPMRGALWVRISAQIFNELGDYQRLADAVLEVRSLGLLGSG